MTTQSALIVGAGAIGIDHHLPRIRAILGYPSVQVYDPNPGRLAQLSDLFKGDTGVTLSSDLPERSFDLVVISTPPKFHLDYYRRYAKRCASCVIEKPMAMSLAECNEIADLASSGGARVFVPMIRRTIPGYALMRQLIERQAFGALESVGAYEGGVFAWNAVSLGSFSRDLNGGGVLMDTGPHTLDLLFQIFDSLTCDEAYVDGFPPAVEANRELRLTANGGVPVSLALSRNRNLSGDLVFHCRDAEVRIGVRSNRMRVQWRDGSAYSLIPDTVTDCKDPSFVQLFDAWYTRFLATGENAGMSAEDAAKIAAVIDKAYESAKPIEGVFGCELQSSERPASSATHSSARSSSART